jgi:predicted Zn-dependent protease
MLDRLSQLKTMLAETPDDPFLKYGIALEIAKTNYQEGITKLKELTRNHPEYLASYYRIGALLSNNNQEAEAIVYLLEGLHLAKVQNEVLAAREIQALLDELTFE